ncbi:hypothetical protein AAFF_G00049600 [Aldrovandia affinis]|uniref:Uncharacterized protein n=1 Tax=Aldrovandia affinis TaxID=143900 RepID=A0AAD7WEZ7_9TELE|nr:hypothetical protein AAFF_G00049600 [Aldrovandia affinis]
MQTELAAFSKETAAMASVERNRRTERPDSGGRDSFPGLKSRSACILLFLEDGSGFRGSLKSPAASDGSPVTRGLPVPLSDWCRTEAAT